MMGILQAIETLCKYIHVQRLQKFFASLSRQNPKWRQSFKFAVRDEHCYLNVCVWKRLTDGGRDMLAGHVSILAAGKLFFSF